MTNQASDDLKGSPERFGYEWGAYAEILPEHEEQFRRWTAPLSPDDWRGKRFLDVGCGMGRNSYWPLKYGAASGVAIDLDERSLESARCNLKSFPNMQILQASACDLSFEENFDLVFSIGVIHHLPNPERALKRMACAAKPGGLVLIWVYGRKNNGWLVSVLNPLRRMLFSRLPVGWTHHLSVSGRPSLDAATARYAADRIFPPHCKIRFSAPAGHSVRPNAAAHLALLAARDSGRNDGRRRARRYPADLGEPDVLVSDWDPSGADRSRGRL
jgi:SAM-dependent methyltransferase